MKKQFSLCLALLCMGALAAKEPGPAISGELVKNGSFEEKRENGRPANWDLSIAGGAKVTMEVSGKDAFVGTYSLSITNETPRKSNVFAFLRQDIALEAGKTYTLSFDARGEEVKGFSIIVGNRWKIRYSPVVTESWKEFTFKFKLEPDDIKDGKAMLLIRSEDVTKQLYVDDIDISPVEN